VPSGRPNEVKLNRISDDDRDWIGSVMSSLKYTNSLLEQLHLEEKEKYTQAQLQAIDTVVAYINTAYNILKEKREEIRERLQADLLDFQDGHAT
jgi:predicted house-cleaning noncanonical NTP pyrophosphatase (MazG superfamily)